MKNYRCQACNTVVTASNLEEAECPICPDKILFYNDKPKGELQHPHINHNNPCLDSFHKDVYKLLGEIRLKELVFLLYRFLKTYTHNGVYYGSQLSEWKKFRDD